MPMSPGPNPYTSGAIMNPYSPYKEGNYFYSGSLSPSGAERPRYHSPYSGGEQYDRMAAEKFWKKWDEHQARNPGQADKLPGTPYKPNFPTHGSLRKLKPSEYTRNQPGYKHNVNSRMKFNYRTLGGD